MLVHSLPLSVQIQTSNFQPCSSYGMHKLITKICGTPKNVILFVHLTQKKGIVFIHSHQMSVFTLAVVIFINNLGKRGQCT